MVAFRQHTLLPLDDCLYALQATIPHLTRSSLHRCLQRHGISWLRDNQNRRAIDARIGSIRVDGVLCSAAVRRSGAAPHQPSTIAGSAAAVVTARELDEPLNTSVRACSDRQIFKRRCTVRNKLLG